jgi:hypothetical protein
MSVGAPIDVMLRKCKPQGKGRGCMTLNKITHKDYIEAYQNGREPWELRFSMHNGTVVLLEEGQYALDMCFEHAGFTIRELVLLLPASWLIFYLVLIGYLR